jgi:hypothetical protein
MATVRIPAPHPRRFRYRSRFGPWPIERAVGASRKTVNKYAEKMVRGIRRTGELIAELPKEQGKRTDKGHSVTGAAKFREEALVSKSTAERWQAVADIPAADFDAAIARVRDADDPKAIITIVPFYRMAKQLQRDAEHAGNEQLVAQAPTLRCLRGVGRSRARRRRKDVEPR